MRIVIAILNLTLIAANAHGASLRGLEAPGQWWSSQAAGYVGAVGGCFGGLIGIFGGLTGWLAPKGKARKFVMGGWYVFLTVGVAVLLAGIVALISKQSYAVCYPLLLPGVLTIVLILSLLPTIRKRYEEFELRKMSTIDAANQKCR